MAQSGSVLVWGARGRGFKSRYPDLIMRFAAPKAVTLNRGCFFIFGVIRFL